MEAGEKKDAAKERVFQAMANIEEATRNQQVGSSMAVQVVLPGLISHGTELEAYWISLCAGECMLA